MDYKRVLILHFTNGMSGREIAETTGDKKTTVNEFLKRFRECEELHCQHHLHVCQACCRAAGRQDEQYFEARCQRYCRYRHLQG